MSSRTRLLLAVLLGVALLGITTVVAATTAVYRSGGTVAVEIHERGGDHVNVVVPAGLVDLAVALVPGRVVGRVTHDLSPDLDAGRFWPAVREAAEALEDCPDALLVEVQSPRERVTVRKTGGRIEIVVDSPHEHVRVELPVRTVTRVVHRLEPALHDI